MDMNQVIVNFLVGFGSGILVLTSWFFYTLDYGRRKYQWTHMDVSEFSEDHDKLINRYNDDPLNQTNIRDLNTCIEEYYATVYAENRKKEQTTKNPGLFITIFWGILYIDLRGDLQVHMEEQIRDFRFTVLYEPLENYLNNEFQNSIKDLQSIPFDLAKIENCIAVLEKVNQAWTDFSVSNPDSMKHMFISTLIAAISITPPELLTYLEEKKLIDSRQHALKLLRYEQFKNELK